MTREFWAHWIPIPGQAERLAGQAEERGFDGPLLADKPESGR
jgi:hypothetical protein